MTDRLLEPKPKRLKSKWMKGFVLLPALTDIEKVAGDRMDMCKEIRNKRIKLTNGR